MSTPRACLIAVALAAACTPASSPPMTHHPEPPPGAAAGPNATIRIHLIDVGQGASTLVEFSCGVVLVDTGGESNNQFDSEQRLTAYLDRFFRLRPRLQNTIALLVITHPHIDHARSALTVFKRYHVLHVVTDGLTTSSGGEQVDSLLRAVDSAHVPEERIAGTQVPAHGLHDDLVDPLSCADGDPDIRAFWGSVTGGDVDWSSEDLLNANNDSVVMRFRLGKASFLITGDLEVAGVGELVNRFGASGDLRADVFQVGHHGSWNATTKPLLDAIQPKIALIQMGPPDRIDTWSAWAYGHPRQETIELLEGALTGPPRAPIHVSIGKGHEEFVSHDVTAPIYATGWDGDVHVTMYADGRITVSPRR